MEGGDFEMKTVRKIWIRWLENKCKDGRFEVGHYWEGYKNPFRKYSWEINGEVWPFTKENKNIAIAFKKFIAGEMQPDPRTKIITYDPTKHFCHRKRSKYALTRYTTIWLGYYDEKIKTADCSSGYVSALYGYIETHILPALGDASLYEIDPITIKEFYLKLARKELSK